MTPSSKWFPTDLQGRNAWFQNFATNFALVAAALGFTPAEVTSVANDAEVMDFLAQTDVTVNAYVDGVRNYRKTMTEGDVNGTSPTFPADLTLAPPIVIGLGIFERLDDLVKRIRVSPSYTEETGALLGILTSGGGHSGPVGDTVPVLKASVDPGHVIEVKFTRGSSDGIYIEKNVNNGGFGFAEKAFKSPAIIVVPGDGIPQQVQLRARFLDGNNPVGDWSSIVTVQTIP